MWFLSCFFTSGWTHSCSREPSTHTLGLGRESRGAQEREGSSPRAAQQPELCGHARGAPANVAHVGSQREWPWPEYSRPERGFVQGPGVSKKPELRLGLQREGDSTAPMCSLTGRQVGQQDSCSSAAGPGQNPAPRGPSDGQPQLPPQGLQGAQGADQGHHAVEAAFSRAGGNGDRPSMPKARGEEEGNNTVDHRVEAIPPQF